MHGKLSHVPKCMHAQNVVKAWDEHQMSSAAAVHLVSDVTELC